MADGVEQCIPVATPAGTYQVWTKRFGDSPTTKLLMLHGGPGATHEYFACLEQPLPAAGIEYHAYDQLGSGRSDRPSDPGLWEIDRFVDEVEQVREALGLGADDFFLLGHSWGGILAIEYALAHQDRLKGLLISNMMASCPAYNGYAREVLMPAMDQDALAEIKRLEADDRWDDPRYGELLQPHYEQHVLRMPSAQWPEPVQRSFADINKDIYVPMQGPSELGMRGNLENWDRTADLGRITVPTLVVGAAHDTMDPAHMEWMAGAVQRGRYLHCPDGSHLAMWDDQDRYVGGLVGFVRDVDAGHF